MYKINWEQSDYTRAIPDISEIRAILASVYPDDIAGCIEFLSGGCSTCNIKFTINKAPLVLRISLKTKSTLSLEQKISDMLIGIGDIPIAKFLRTGTACGYEYAITEYMKGNLLRDYLTNDKGYDLTHVMYQVGSILAKIKKVKFKAAGFLDDNLVISKQHTYADIKVFVNSKLNSCKITNLLSESLKQRINSFINCNYVAGIEKDSNLVHADFNPANILVHDIDGLLHVSAILDWEFAFSGSTLWDVANMLRYSHEMPYRYSQAFLLGLNSNDATLPQNWQEITKSLNIISLLDCLYNTKIDTSPNRVNDILNLLETNLSTEPKVVVVPYDPLWPQQYVAEKNKLERALADNIINIYHIGSTSVPNLIAKPKIDIIAEVKNLNFPDTLLLELGYIYRSGFNLPFRRSYTFRSAELNINLHIFQENDPEIELNLCFRDYLRENVAVREKYAKLKLELMNSSATHQKNNMYSDYTLGKNKFIQEALISRKFKRIRLVIGTHHSEIAEIKKIRNQVKANLAKIDQDLWTLLSDRHYHTLLYKGLNIVAYAHVEFLANNNVCIPMIATTTNDFAMEKELIILLNKWFILENKQLIFIRVNPSKLENYIEQGFIQSKVDSIANFSLENNLLLLEKKL